MAINEQIEKAIFEADEQNFDSLCLQVFKYQYENNDFYRRFAKAIGKSPAHVHSITDIPFLPIQFFKSQQIISGSAAIPALFFESSGTTGSINSRHYVVKEALYVQSFTKAFRCRTDKTLNMDVI
ncbi:MAG: hypothetical protein EON58_06990 [Alphaproteobacteria bacterium]|nr:MAG: hypothetical protein EON58_06990 [Alphaproteobacteria bacterium]